MTLLLACRLESHGDHYDVKMQSSFRNLAGTGFQALRICKPFRISKPFFTNSAAFFQAVHMQKRCGPSGLLGQLGGCRSQQNQSHGQLAAKNLARAANESLQQKCWLRSTSFRAALEAPRSQAQAEKAWQAKQLSFPRYNSHGIFGKKLKRKQLAQKNKPRLEPRTRDLVDSYGGRQFVLPLYAVNQKQWQKDMRHDTSKTFRAKEWAKRRKI